MFLLTYKELYYLCCKLWFSNDFFCKLSVTEKYNIHCMKYRKNTTSWCLRRTTIEPHPKSVQRSSRPNTYFPKTSSDTFCAWVFAQNGRFRPQMCMLFCVRPSHTSCSIHPNTITNCALPHYLLLPVLCYFLSLASDILLRTDNLITCPFPRVRDQICLSLSTPYVLLETEFSNVLNL
jgi:hypothetical protein